MTKGERAKAVLERLRPHYPDRQPLLAYRNGFELMVAVILSAQTTDSQVNRITPALFQSYPDPDSLARAPRDQIEEIIRPTGFYRAKARSIQAAAAGLAERFGGEVPRSIEELVKLQGVGRKSANAIVGALYGEPAIIVDTHFGRVCRRLELTESSNPDRVEREMAAILPEQDRYDFSMVVNFHGRYVCKSRKPECDRCPVRDVCPYPDRQGRQQANRQTDRQTDRRTDRRTGRQADHRSDEQSTSSAS